MKKIIGILAVFFFMASGLEVFGADDLQMGGAQNAYHLVDGLKYRSEGNCVDAIKSYQMAKELKQFKEDWIYYLAVADCFVALKRLDDAIDAYTKVIDSTQNRTLQTEMYKGRAKAYYLKSARPDTIDMKLVDHARKDMDLARSLGADVSDLERTIAEDIETKPARADAEEGKIVITDKPVTVVEGPDKLVVGDGEYVLYISRDTRINDQKGMAIPASNIKPGDLIDFSFIMSYRNKADGMTHLSAKTITLHRDAGLNPSGIEERLPSSTEMLILAQMTTLAAEIRDLKENRGRAGKEAEIKTGKKVTSKKHRSKKKKVEVNKAKPVINNPPANQ